MGQQVKVRKFKGERKLERGLRQMGRDGWTVQSQQSRKAWWSWLTGVFTRKQIHTVTFVRDDSVETPMAAAPKEVAQ